MFSLAVSAVALSLPLTVSGTTYSLQTAFQGSSFFTGWNFSTAVDQNFGNAAFQSQSVATSQGLAVINSAGNAVIKIDNTTVGNPADESFGRSSVYMTTLNSINAGSLVMMDALHVPYGCSVWPALFMEGIDAVWPTKGEIDLFENVNLATANQYSLHTFPSGCFHPNSSSGETGTLQATDCFNETASNTGCVVKEAQSGSFGEAFSTQGGGGFAVEYDDSGITFWYFPRSSLPSDWNSSSPDPSNWGTPSAVYPASSCDIQQFFGPQTLILDIDICGSFAGDGGAYNETCASQGSCLGLVRTPTNYDTAYFEISFIKVFTNGSASASGNSSSSSSGSSSSGSTGSSSASKLMSVSLFNAVAAAVITAGLALATSGLFVVA